jgi:uncharacterized protein (DUF1810 family)
VETIFPKFRSDFHPPVEVEACVSPFQTARAAVLDQPLIGARQKSM